MSPDTNAALSSRLGVFVQAGIGQAYPDLVEIVRQIYRTRVSKLAFVPATWLAGVLEAMAGGDLVLPTPVGFRSLAYPIPSWLSDDPAALAAWAQVNGIVGDAKARYVAGRIEEGRAIMAAAEANVAFWDTLYTAAVAVRDLPGNAVAAVGTGAVSALSSFISKAWWVLALVGIGLVVWYGRGTFGRMAARKLAGAA